ncbi:ribonuclease P/MRP protein subunit POP5 [Ochlerotatus camptorhynchus]|uniref:ribonuclease P/MRP protein subunit POP5 n=1 Tax=Ochlerotatus camptorhynchus TaxID=644619 RepID=UPI0031D551A2
MVRVKNRYILVQFMCNNRSDTDAFALTSTHLSGFLREKIEKYYGEYGLASTLRLNVIYFNEKTRLCIIQTRHGPHRFVTSILPLLTVADTETVRYRTLYVGATLKQCQKFIVRYQQEYVNKMIGLYKGEVQKERFIEEVTKMKQI